MQDSDAANCAAHLVRARTAAEALATVGPADARAAARDAATQAASMLRIALHRIGAQAGGGPAAEADVVALPVDAAVAAAVEAGRADGAAAAVQGEGGSLMWQGVIVAVADDAARGHASAAAASLAAAAAAAPAAGAAPAAASAAWLAVGQRYAAACAAVEASRAAADTAPSPEEGAVSALLIVAEAELKIGRFVAQALSVRHPPQTDPLSRVAQPGRKVTEAGCACR